ncbi:hypothetical protein BV25DRAFT_1649571 [Artomyces pyxidatus]|uniref:Uncharacterized protein n=1 Tax=Artomyces pyxidatus TaxID=48021 RepID=A0ACB8SJX1_9AGAM|nr:hypothetical protein BV25DRAFT_1649571 [Artomyces pyxidatus]
MLRLMNISRMVFDDIYKAIRQPAPLLRTFFLACIRNSDGALLPPDFLQDHAPQLRHVTLHNMVGFPWTSVILTHLVSLELVLSPFTEESPLPSLQDVVLALSNMEALETLIILHQLPLLTHGPISIATLPRLAHLQLMGALSRCTGYLSAIKTPNNPKLDLRMECSRDDGLEAHRSFFAALAAFLRHQFARPNTDALDISSNDKPGEFIALTHAEGSYMERCSLAFLYPNIDRRNWRINIPLIRSSCETFGCYVRDLSISACWSYKALLNVLARVPEVQKLTVKGQAAMRLCIALSTFIHYPPNAPERPDLEGGEVEERVQMVLPALEELTLRELNLLNLTSFAGETELTYAHRALQNCLIARTKAGFPLRRLVLLKCKVPTEAVNLLKEIVPCVDCNQGRRDPKTT